MLLVDHRPIVGGGRPYVGVQHWVDAARGVVDIGVRIVRPVPVAVRGERLALLRLLYGDDQSSMETLNVVELDEQGRLGANVIFDPPELDDAMAELERRAAAQPEQLDLADREAALRRPDEPSPEPEEPGLENEATRVAARWAPLLLARRWDDLIELFAEDMVGRDNRPMIGAEPLVGRTANLVGNWGVLDVGVTNIRFAPLTLAGERAALFQAEYSGSAGAIEVLQVIDVDEAGRMLHSEVFDLDQHAQALARLHELAAEGAVVPENRARLDALAADPDPAVEDHAATDARLAELSRVDQLEGVVRALHEALNAHDLDALAAVVSEQAVLVDHPPTSGMPIRGDEYVDVCAQRFANVPDASWSITAVHGSDDGVAFFTEEVGGTRRLVVLAVDHGRVIEVHTYAPEDPAAAEARFAELGSGLHLESTASRAVRVGNDVGLAGNWDAARAGVHADVVLTDRRPLLGGFTVDGAEAYVGFARSVFSTGVAHVSVEARAKRGEHLALVHVVHSGATASLVTEQVVQLDDSGRHILRHELFEPAQHDEAISLLDDLFAAAARFAELAAADVDQVPLVRRTWLRFIEVAGIGDVDAMFEQFADTAVWRDHRPLVGGEWRGDDLRPFVEAFARSGRVRIEWAPIATRGDRAEVGMLRFHGNRTQVDAARPWPRSTSRDGSRR